MDANETLKKWFSEYHRELFLFLRKLSRDHHLAQDLIQETYVRAYLKFHLYDPSRGKLKNWLYRIAINLYHDHLRFESREQETVRKLSVEKQLESQGDKNGEECFKILLERAVDSLIPEKREILLLSLDNKLEEVGRILDLPEGTVKSRLFHIRRELQSLIEKLETEA
ncbi:MAG: RNA polymerase sigma factor [Candidatus Wallbacteria bacterium]|nr:RNA polymerase sigma factor [Candidatus Wallbacteria bacterium]